MKLTIKQKAFADFYIQLGNATEAYIEAGYKSATRNVAEVNAHKLLRNAKVKKYIEERLSELDSERIADQKEILQYFTSVMRGESRSCVVVVEGCGEGCSSAKLVEKPPDEKERLKAAEMLGKVHGMFTDKMQINGDLGVQIVDDVDDDEE